MFLALYCALLAAGFHGVEPGSASSPPVHPPEGSDSAIPVVRRMLESDQVPVRSEVLDLAERTSESELNTVRYKALFHEDTTLRHKAAESLAESGDPALVTRLLDTLHSGTLFEVQVIEDTASILQPAIEKPLIALLDAGDSTLSRKMLAAYLLGCMKAPDALEHLAGHVWRETEFELAMACIQALGRMRIEETLPYFRSMLGHSREEIRWEAVHGVGNLRSRAALDTLVMVATNGSEPNEMIRRQALLYLGASDNAEAIPLLLQCMQYSQSLRDVAGEALRQLTGRRYGASPIEWGRWYEEQLRTVSSPEELLYSHKVKEAARQQQQQQALQNRVDIEVVPEF